MVNNHRVSKAVVGYVHPDYVRGEFMASMLALQRRTTIPIDTILHVHSGPNIARARNSLVRAFLDRNADWLMMVDTDMVFRYDTLDRLVRAADPVLRPIMGAFCLMEEQRGGEALPTLYEISEGVNGIGFARYLEWPDDAVFRIGATGTGCVVFHRSVFEIVAANPKTTQPAWPWFRETSLDGRPLGEDFSFMIRCAINDLPVHVHTGVQVGHMKSSMLGKVS